MADAGLSGLTEQQALRLHASWQLRRWNPELRRDAAIRGFDWVAPLALLGAATLPLLVAHPLVVAGALAFAAGVSFAVGVRHVRRRRVRQLTDLLLVAGTLEGARSAEALIARCAGDPDELDRRLTALVV
jgi:hypothetical protein